jgi:secreted protein with Ig-like and vWFA domain
MVSKRFCAARANCCANASNEKSKPNQPPNVGRQTEFTTVNASNENHDPSQSDDPRDRLIDVALAELIGGQAPPDLTSQIAATANIRQLAATRQAPRSRGYRTYWASLAVAVMLLIGVTLAIVPTIQSTKESARVDRAGNYSTKVEQRAVIQLSRNASETAAGDDIADQLQKVNEAARSSISARHPAPEGGPKADFAFAQSTISDHSTALSYGEGMSQDHLSSNGSYFTTIDANGNPRGLRKPALDESELGLNYRGHGGTADGTGPGLSGDKYTRIIENPFVKAEGGAAVSTFSIDVDTASYSNVRQFLTEMNRLPPPDAVRIEELINYFHYNYAPPPNTPAAPGSARGSAEKSVEAAPFACHVEVAGCPWAPEHRLVRIGVKGRELDRKKRPQSNLVFLIDVSGSMDEPAKLPLVIYGLEQLTRELGENDRVAIVVYASNEGLVLPSTPGTKQETILAALSKLKAGGSTAGGAGIQLAYQLAEDNFIKGGVNRVILCTDGDFNVGTTSTAELERLVEKKAKDTRVFLSVLGFGRGNLNDSMMEAISNHGNGNYHYVDNRTEARRVLVEEMSGTLVTIAKDVKIQVEFNPTQVAGYRLIGYEDRMLRTEDFNDDKKDAGEIGAGHTVTALYEVVPAGKKVDVGAVDELKYQKGVQQIRVISAKDDPKAVDSSYTEPGSLELLTLKMRYKAPDGDTSKKLEWAITDDRKSFSAASNDFKFASAVAGFGMLLRDSQYKGNLKYAAVLETAQGSLGEDPHGYRKEFVEMIRKAKELKGE